MDSEEIKRLKEKNDELMVNLKRFSRELDQRVGHFSLAKPGTQRPQHDSARLESELGCVASMRSVYLKEIQQLKTRLGQRSGFGTVLEAEREIRASAGRQTELQERIRATKKKMKQHEKQLEAVSFRASVGANQVEVPSRGANG